MAANAVNWCVAEILPLNANRACRTRNYDTELEENKTSLESCTDHPLVVKPLVVWKVSCFESNLSDFLKSSWYVLNSKRKLEYMFIF